MRALNDTMAGIAGIERGTVAATETGKGTVAATVTVTVTVIVTDGRRIEHVTEHTVREEELKLQYASTLVMR